MKNRLNLKYKGEKLNLREAERKILLALMGRPLVTANDIVEILWPHPDDQPDYWYNSVTIRIFNIRKELKRLNSHWIIVGVFGRGWMLQ